MDTSFLSSSTHGFNANETALSGLQGELASGSKVPTAAANPGAYIGARADNSTQQQISTLEASQVNIQDNLGVGTSALGQMSTVLDHIQSIALQAANGPTNPLDYPALSGQVTQGLQLSISLANTQDRGGNYVFSGTARQTQPFVQSSSGGVTYLGNDGVSSVEIAPNVSVNSALSGSAFMNGMDGNGYASVSAAAGNTGSATVFATGVATAAAADAFQSGTTPIMLSFSSGPGGATVYTATSGSSTVGSGTVQNTDGATTTVTLAGVEYTISGKPAAGDTFSLTPARPQSMFNVIGTIGAALKSPGSTPAARAQISQVIGNALGAITQYQNRLAAVSAKAGVTLQAVSNAATADSLASTNATNDKNSLTAANIPQVLSQINERTTSLQAAMKAFALTSNLSLFKYL